MARIYDNIEVKFTEGLQGIISSPGVGHVLASPTPATTSTDTGIILSYISRRFAQRRFFCTWRVYISLKIAYLRPFLVKSLMDNNRKLLYDPPVIEIVDVKTEGLVCDSNTYNGFGEEEIW